MLALALVIIGPLLVFLAFVVYDTIRGNGDFGLNLSRPKCPRCKFRLNAELSMPAVPDMRPNRWECPVCCIVTDQWGNELAPAISIKKEIMRIPEPNPDFNQPLDSVGRTPIERVMEEK